MENGMGVMFYGKGKSMDELVMEAAEYYQKRCGKAATVALVSEGDLVGERMVGEIKVVGVPYIQPHHVLTGVGGLLL